MRNPLEARRYLALMFPWLPIERLRNDRPHLFVDGSDAPVVFVETVGGAVRLAAIDLAAAQAGLQPGLTLAAARKQAPELEVFPHDPHADLDWLERLADGCARYTPTVALDPPDGLTLDLSGDVHAFGTERLLAADVEARMARRGIMVRYAFGDTPHAARALARFSGAPAPDEARALRRLPVAALELDAEDMLALTRAGLKTVGDVMAHPLATVAARFGEGAATAVRQFQGEGKAPVVPHRRAAPIFAERRFAEPIGRMEDALAVLGELAAEAGEVLERRQRGGRRWEVRLFRADGQVHRLRVETGQPTRDVALLGRLLRERLGVLADPLDPGFGYDLVRLDVMLAEPLVANQLRLEGGAAERGGVGQLVEPLSVQRSGGRVRRLAARGGYSPEQAELSLPAAAPATPEAWPGSEDEPPLRPIHLFDPPQPIDAIAAEHPDGPPARFRWRRKLHDVARVEGPERIAGESWRRSPPPPPRDYFRLEDRRGRRFWIFRQGEYAEGEPPPRWYVHGLFA